MKDLEIVKDEGILVFWKLYSIEPMTEEEAQQYQNNKGKHPAGYGFQRFNCRREEDFRGRDIYVTTWSCYSNCD